MFVAAAATSTGDFRNEAANVVPIWLDYTSLRQCVFDDFNLPHICELIMSVPVFVAAPDSISYTSRSFCVFELYNAHRGRVQGDQELWVTQNFAPNTKRMRAECESISTTTAGTRSRTHKELIDTYIIKNIPNGFAGLDKMVADVFMESVERGGVGGGCKYSIQ